MKANWLKWVLLLWFAVGVLPLAVQPSEADRKMLADLRAKAKEGDAPSQYELGRAFALGQHGLATNYAEAVKWFRKAAEQNFAEAQCNLGRCYARGNGLAKDEVEGNKWL